MKTLAVCILILGAIGLFVLAPSRSENELGAERPADPVAAQRPENDLQRVFPEGAARDALPAARSQDDLPRFDRYGKPVSRPANFGAVSVTAPSPAKSLWKKEELYLVRGVVLEATGGRAVIECDSRSKYADIQNISLGVGAGKNVAKNLFAISDDQEKKRYGEPLVVAEGRLRRADWEPNHSAVGTVAVYGVPEQMWAVGTGVKLISAPLGESEYTLAYQIDPEPRGAWMWKK